MATASEWLEGARLRTLPAAVSPVLAGTGIAVYFHGAHWLRALLCLVVALALQIGVNYANDYSDGIRGTDAERDGPLRLVGSGVATPAAVKAAAFACFGVAAVAGLVLVILSHQWWLLAVGALAVLAAWFYTGGSHPYGYLGLGEVMVFIFFGLVAVCGTTYVQLGRAPAAAWAIASSIGALACAILVANNLRDVATDVVAGKHTLATRLGDRNTRYFFVALDVVALVLVVVTAALTSWWVLLGLVALVFVVPSVRAVLAGVGGRGLIAVLQHTGFAELAVSAGVLLGCWLGAR